MRLSAIFSILLPMLLCLPAQTLAKSNSDCKQYQCDERSLAPRDQFLLAISRDQLGRAQQLRQSSHFAIDYRSSQAYIVEQTQVRADISYPYMAGNNRYRFASGTAFDIALSRFNITAVKWLLAQGVKPEAGYFANLIQRAKFNRVYPNQYLTLPYRERRLIIAVGYALELAVQQNKPNAVNKLLSLEPRAIHYRGNVILSKAIEQGKWPIVNSLLHRGKDIDLLVNFLALFDTALRSEPTQYDLLK